jgi:hypothetical protein
MSDIKDPYAITKTAPSTYSVMFRYMIGSKLCWKGVAHRMDKDVATRVAKLLNKDLRGE